MGDTFQVKCLMLSRLPTPPVGVQGGGWLPSESCAHSPGFAVVILEWILKEMLAQGR